MLSFQPLFDNLLVRRVEPANSKPSTILIPDTAKEKTLEVEVLAVGPGRWEFGVFVPMSVEVGQLVLVQKYAGHEIELNGEKLVIVPQSQVLGILDVTQRLGNG